MHLPPPPALLPRRTAVPNLSRLTSSMSPRPPLQPYRWTNSQARRHGSPSYGVPDAWDLIAETTWGPQVHVALPLIQVVTLCWCLPYLIARHQKAAFSNVLHWWHLLWRHCVRVLRQLYCLLPLQQPGVLWEQCVLRVRTPVFLSRWVVQRRHVPAACCLVAAVALTYSCFRLMPPVPL